MPISLMGNLTIDNCGNAWKLVRVFAFMGVLWFIFAINANFVIRVPPLHFLFKCFPLLMAMYVIDFSVSVYAISTLFIILCQYILSSNWATGQKELGPK